MNDKRRVEKLAKTKQTEVGLRQAFIPFNDKNSLESILSTISKERKKVTNCNQFTSFAKATGSTISPNMIGAQLSAPNPSIKKVVRNLSNNKISPPIKSKSGIHVMMVCGKTERPASIIDKKKIKEELFRQKMDLMSRQYLRNLRRNTYIEVRL